MAESHREPLDEQSGHRFLWARNATASATLVVSLVSLNVILSNLYGTGLRDVAAHGLDIIDPAPAPAPVPVTVMLPATDGKHLAIGNYLARRYRVSAEMTTEVVAKAYNIGAELKLDPILILAVIAVESRFNPVAESIMGAKGLMQVIPRFHSDKFRPHGGEKAAFDVQTNISVGAKILQEYLRRTGDITDALQLYVGAGSDENENAYSDKVMAERDRLYQILRQHQIRTHNAQRRTPGRPGSAAT